MSRSDRQARASAGALQGPRIMLMLAVLALLLIGLVMVYSTSSVTLASEEADPMASFLSQAMWAVIGVVAALVLWRIPYTWWTGSLVWVIWFVGMVLLAATWGFGDDAGMGAQRWIYIGSMSVQPSEFVKIVFLLVAVRTLADYHAGIVELRVTFIRVFLMTLVPLVFLYKTQSDLGTTLIIAVALFGVMWMGGVSKRVLGGVAILGVIFALFAIFGSGYRSGRMSFLNPWDDGEGGYGDGFNLIRSLYAIAEGGLLGVGLGSSHEKYDYLFASDNDFIFAVICEELGMVGALVVIALYLCILYAGLRIASETEDEIGSLLAGGCAVMLATQAFLNIGSTIGVLPTTGKPLPFISSGGTSLVASFLLVGLMLSVSCVPAESSVYERRRADLRIVRATGGAERASAERPSARPAGSVRGGSPAQARTSRAGAPARPSRGRETSRGTSRPERSATRASRDARARRSGSESRRRNSSSRL